MNLQVMIKLMNVPYESSYYMKSIDLRNESIWMTNLVTLKLLVESLVFHVNSSYGGICII